jgi:flagellar P-ring protein precursor FlgI
VDPRDVRARNVAAVMVTARLPTFTRPGMRIDVTVSSLGNARSLAGGTLLMTPIAGPDGQVYAVGQGPVQVGGFEAGARGSLVRKNLPTSGRVPSGATVERAVLVDLAAGPLVLQLNDPDAATASRIAAAVQALLGEGSARALDPAAVEVKVPEASRKDPVGLLARLEELEVEADRRARVVVSERTGTVVAGERVRLRPAAVAHGGLQVAIGQRPVVSQPNPFGEGRTVETPVAQVEAAELGRGIAALPATSTVDELVRALNALGASPRDLVAILQALEAAGALDAELEVL